MVQERLLSVDRSPGPTEKGPVGMPKGMPTDASAPLSVESRRRASWTGMLCALPRLRSAFLQATLGVALHSGQASRHQPARRMKSCWVSDR